MKRDSILEDKGFTLIELLITLTVLSFGLLGLAGMQVHMVRANKFTTDMTIATAIGSDLVEEAKAISLSGLASGRLLVTSGDNVVGSFTYGDINGDRVLDPGDIDINGDGVPDDPYNGRFSWTRMLNRNPGAFVSYRINVSVFWNNPYAPQNPHQISIVDSVP